MTKAGKYLIMAIGMAVLGLFEAVSGFILWLGFPARGDGVGRGGGGSGTLTFWDLSRHTWIDIHDWVAVALVVLVLVHVILHWTWIVRMTKAIFRGQSKRLVPVLVRDK